MRIAAASGRRRATPLDMLFFETPSLWRHYPFLPVIRRRSDDAGTECGVLYDARGVSGLYGYSSTVFRINLFALPATEAGLLARPKYVYDSLDALAEDGWRVDWAACGPSPGCGVLGTNCGRDAGSGARAATRSGKFPADRAPSNPSNYPAPQTSIRLKRPWPSRARRTQTPLPPLGGLLSDPGRLPGDLPGAWNCFGKPFSTSWVLHCQPFPWEKPS